MKNVLADRPSTQNDSLESKENSHPDVIELNRDRLSKSLMKELSSPKQTKGDQQAQNTARNRYTSVPRSSSTVTRQPSWERIRHGAIEGAKWATFSVVAIAIAAMVLYEPSPSKKEQQPASTKNSPQTELMPPLEVPTSPSPKETLPLPDAAALPQLSPQQKALGKQPLTLNPSQKSQDQPLSTNPSLDKAPSSEPDLSSEPSLSESNPVIPPTLPANLPPVEPPCGCAQGCSQEEASSGVSDTNANTNQNSPVVEAKEYFKKGWQPPAGVKQTLEYSVSINADGTIKRIMPLSNAAGEYIDRTNLPMPGSQFVSPREGGGNTNIYVAFSPDGKVKTSLE